jgi:hypothetical protein
MFHRNDIQAAGRTVHRSYSKQQLIEGIRADDTGMPLFTPGFSAEIPLVYRTRINSFDGRTDEQDHEPVDPIVADNEELSWYHSEKGLVKINSKRTQALIGFVRDARESVPNLQADVENPFCSILLSSMEDRPIASAGRLILAITARSGLTGMKWNDERTSLVDFGSKPAMLEVVKGSVILTDLDAFKLAELSYLDGNGQVIGKKIYTKDNRIEVPLGERPAPWLLIRFER